jgi:hypothetical protein
LEGFRNWSFVAIGAYIRAVAGADHPQIGRVVPKDDPKKRTTRSKAWGKTRHIQKTLGGPGPNHEFHEFDPDDPMVRLFHKPNPQDTAYDLWAYTVLFHQLCGYVVLWIIRDERGIPREMWPIPTHWIQLLQTNSDGSPGNYLVQSPWGQRLDIPWEQTISLTEHSPFSRWEGYAVSIAIAEWLDTYESLIRVRLAQFKNGAVPNIHVALGESYSDPDEAFLARFYAKWFSRFQGENNAGLPLITGPDIEVKPIGSIPYQLYSQEEESIRTEVLAAFGVPQALVSGDPSVDTSAYAPARTFARINPMLKYYGEKFSEKVIKITPGYEDGVLFWKDQAPLDPQFELNKDQAMMDRSSMTPNEWRIKHGLEPFEFGGDDPMMNNAPVPWASGRRPEPDEEIDQEIRRLSMGESSGGAGGYLIGRNENGRIAVLNGHK